MSKPLTLLRTLLLLSPVYVCFFWAITLLGSKKSLNAPQSVLLKLLILIAICFFSHFLYFAPYPDLYARFDVLLYILGSLLFPLYYIYFRLLTVDSEFTFKKHGSILIITNIIAIVYAVGVINTPFDEYKVWLFNKYAFPDSPSVHFLNVMRKILTVQFLLVTSACFIGSFHLLRKYADKAEEFYSDINDGKYNNSKNLAKTIIYSSIACSIAIILGREIIILKEYIIYAIWTILTVTLYMIGYMGMKQKPVNPTFELITSPTDNNLSDVSTSVQKKILGKITEEFEVRKIHLNCQLNIMDLVEAVGTNRTYISAIINQHYHQNFCSFVNNYRIAELEKTIGGNSELTNEMLAEKCGFGSVSSMKRAVYAKTGLSFSEWKENIAH